MHQVSACPVCGSVVVNNGGCGRRRIYCGKACNAKATYRRRLAINPLPLSEKFTCPECGDVVPAKKRTGPRATYCSASCRRQASKPRGTERRRERAAEEREPIPARTCPECADDFTPKTSRQKYCDKKCQANFNRDRADKPTCSEPDCDRPVRAKGVCAMHRKRQVERPKDRMTKTRRANLRRKTQKRRARLAGDIDATTIDRDVIGERDGWRCGLCRKHVDRSLAYPHVKSPSLDHIEPLSLGGKHIASNVQIAHLACNMAKGNRVTDVQLLLVG